MILKEFRFIGMASNSTALVQTRAGEAKGPFLVLQQDQADDNADTWGIGQNAGDGGANTNIHWASYTSGSWVNKMRLLHFSSVRCCRCSKC